VSTDQSLVHHTRTGATVLTGDAIPLFGVIALKGAIKLHKATGLVPRRGVTITSMLTQAGRVTGKRYKRGGHDAAVADLEAWIAAAKASMPVLDERG